MIRPPSVAKSKRATMAAILAVLSLLLLLSASPYASADSAQDFFQCFTEQSKNPSIILSPDTPSYVSLFNSTVRNSRLLTSTWPSFIVTPEKPSDVQAAVTCGKTHNFHLRVRSGGHDYEARSSFSNGDPFVTVDFVNFQSITVDAKEGTAWVGSGATVGQLYYNINAQTKNDLVGFPASLCTSVGIGGILNGGGLSAIGRKYGTSADLVVDAQIVDVNGKVLDREAMGEELFWAIRGGSSASFGVVLAYKVKLVAVSPTVSLFRVNRILEQNLSSLVTKWQTFSHDATPDLFIRAIAVANGTGQSRTIVATFEGMYLGKSSEFLATLQKDFPELGIQATDVNETNWIQSTLFLYNLPTTNVSLLHDRRPFRNLTFKGKSDFATTPIDEYGWDKIWKYLLDAVDQNLQVILSPWGGKFDEIAPDAIPFPHRKGTLFNLQYFLFWPPSNDTINQGKLDWMKGFYNFMAPYVSSNPRGTYFNVKDLDLGTNEVGKTNYSSATAWGRTYFKDNFERLARIKAEVDPSDYFWNEQSIPPFSQ